MGTPPKDNSWGGTIAGRTQCTHCLTAVGIRPLSPSCTSTAPACKAITLRRWRRDFAGMGLRGLVYKDPCR